MEQIWADFGSVGNIEKKLGRLLGIFEGGFFHDFMVKK